MKRLYKQGKRQAPIRKPAVLVSQQDGEMLRSLYNEKGLSAARIARKFGVSDTLILRRLKMFQIRRARNLEMSLLQSIQISTMFETEKATPIHWIFDCPCFACKDQPRCCSNSFYESPRQCARLSEWLFKQT
jgi:hypothetical protein